MVIAQTPSATTIASAIHPPVLMALSPCCPTIAHAKFPAAHAALRAARATGHRLVFCVLFPAVVQLLHASTGARQLWRSAGHRRPAAAVHGDFRRDAPAGAGVRVAVHAACARAAAAGGLRVLLPEPGLVLAGDRCAAVLRLAEHLQPVRGLGVLEL